MSVINPHDELTAAGLREQRFGPALEQPQRIVAQAVWWEQVDDGRERDRRRRRGRPHPLDHRAGLTRARQRLARQPRLAEPGVAGDHDSAAAGRFDGSRDRSDLALATDEQGLTATLWFRCDRTSLHLEVCRARPGLTSASPPCAGLHQISALLRRGRSISPGVVSNPQPDSAAGARVTRGRAARPRVARRRRRDRVEPRMRRPRAPHHPR